MVGCFSEETGLRLAHNQQEFCPNLRSTQCYDMKFHTGSGVPGQPDGMVHVAKAYAPGNLVHDALARWTFELCLRDALLAH